MAVAPTVTGVRIESVLAGLSGTLGVFTVVFREWLEVLGWDPDHGSGAVEAGIVLALLVVAVVLAMAARRHRRLLLATAPG